jgi:hypothetical protein
VRTTFFILLLANLLVAAWAEWIAVPPSHSDPLAGVPRLQLVAETATPAPPGTGAVPAPSGALGSALAAQADGAPVSGGQGHDPALQCLSVGPFQRNRQALEVAALLRAAHFAPQPRTAAVHPVRWYWVYVPDVSRSAQVQRALNVLNRDGIAGAEAMPTADGTLGISLGLFRNRALAQRQLALARAKGFAAQLTGRLVAQPIYWVDVWAAEGAGALPMQTLRTKLGTAVGTQSCPQGDTPPLPSNATGAVAPGLPLPADEATAAPPP